MAAESQGYSTKVLRQLETCIPSRGLDSDRYIDGMTIAIVWGEKHEVNRKNDTVLTIVIFSCDIARLSV
jgi:hypothetical protein